MQVHESGVYTPIAIGIDWVTATAKAGSDSLRFEQIADRHFAEMKSAGRDVTGASRLGYVGQSEGGFFLGRRPDGNCIIMSGPHSDPLTREVIQSASNVSRLDVQVTFWTHGEQPHLAKQGFAQFRNAHPGVGRPANITLIEGWPTGETLNINKRVSDYCGRVYDKASEAKLGLARTLWRYELEVKREPAKRLALSIVAAESPQMFIYFKTKQWFIGKHIDWPGPRMRDCHLDTTGNVEPTRDALAWFRSSVSKSIAREISHHGLDAVLDALGLSNLVQRRTVNDKGNT